jgi:hypothetical protein
VTHNPEDFPIGDSIIVMTEGVIGFEGNYSELLAHPLSVELLRADWGLDGLRRELTSLGVALPDYYDNSRLSDWLLKVVKK